MNVENKILLITGGTGSFGTEVLEKLREQKFREIRIFSRDEKKQEDLRIKLKDSRVKFYIGDVRDAEAVDNVMRDVDYLFHAAALKQVPSCEFFPIEAVKTNVMGTNNVLTSAVRHHVERVVVLSTDKAAYPINAMGISKAMMEKVAIAKGRALGNNAATTICVTRYGNVMASRGSVIPLWLDQIKMKKDITITDKAMTRFMMTLEDAVDLVIFAFENGSNGDLFVQKAPAATLEVLSQALIDLTNSSSKVSSIGTRHGEKLYETLVTREEMSKHIDMGNYFRIPCDERDLNYAKYTGEGISTDINNVEYHSHNTVQLTINGMKDLLMKLSVVRDFIKNGY